MRAFLLPLLCILMVSLLAGCFGGKENAEESTSDARDADGYLIEAPPLAMPTWAVGDYWTWSFEGGSDTDHVVTGSDGGSWLVDPSSTGTALHHARDEVSMLGKIRKSDLAGSQGSSWVRFVDWPLTPGKSWTTTWDDEKLTVTAFAESPTRYTMVAEDDQGNQRVRYSYDALVSWFDHMAFFDAETGGAFHMQLTGHGSNFTDETYRYTLTQVAELATVGVESDAQAFDVPESVLEIEFNFNVTCGTDPAGLVHVYAAPDDGSDPAGQDRPFEEGLTCADEPSKGQMVVAATSGMWNAVAEGIGVDLTAQLVVVLRTLETVTIA